MSGAVYEAVAFAMRYWFVLALFVVLITVILSSVNEYRQRKYIMGEVGQYVGYLEVASGPEENLGSRYGIKPENTVGRLSKCDISLQDFSVSKTHALLYKKEDDLIVSPLSRAVTMVNGKKLTKPQILKTGDIVTFGEVDVKVFIKRTRLQNDY